MGGTASLSLLPTSYAPLTIPSSKWPSTGQAVKAGARVSQIGAQILIDMPTGTLFQRLEAGDADVSLD